MRRIHNFKTFSSLLEADAPATQQSKLYDTTLNQIISAIINNYTAEVPYPVEPYADKVEADIKYVSLAPAERKIERIKEIIERVNQAAEDNKDPEAQEVLQAWVEAGNKAVEALESLIDQYQNDPEDLKYIGSVIDSRLEEYLKELEEIEKEEAETAQNSSFSWKEGEMVSEGIFDGKGGMIDEIESQISIISAKLGNLAKNPGMATEISKFQNELLRISERMGVLRQSKRKDINKDELKRISFRLSQIPEEAEAAGQKIAKQDTVNKNAATILIQALELASKAYALEQEYQKKKIAAELKVKQEEQKARDEAREKKAKIKVSDIIEFDPAAAGKVNDEVKNVQQLIIDKFGDLDDIKDLPQYQEFARFGADGKFGPRTQEMIKIIQRGLDEPRMDPSGNISPDFVYRIQTEDIINESARHIFRFKEFDSILEGFKVKNAVEYAKKRPSYNRSTSGGGSGSSGGGSGSSGGGSGSGSGSSGGGSVSTKDYSKMTDDEKWKELSSKTWEASKTTLTKDSSGNEIVRVQWGPDKDLNYTFYTDHYKPEGGKPGKYQDWKTMNSTKQVIKSEDGTWTFKQDGSLDWSPSSCNVYEVVADILGATRGAGTDPKKLRSAIELIKTPDDLQAVQDEIKNQAGTGKEYGGEDIPSDWNSIEAIINDEFDSGNEWSAARIADWLNSLSGVKSSYETYPVVNGNGGGFKSRSFKISIS